MHFKRLGLHKFILSGITPLMILTAAQAQTTTPQLGRNKTSEVVAAMTLAEKASMVIGGGRDAAPSMTDGSMIGRTDFRIPGGAGVTNSIPRLGIPAMVLVDGPAGVRMDVRRKGDSSRRYFATAFPSETTLASTWNTELVTRVGEAFGNEVKEFGADIILAPGVNIHRNPLGGRNFEYYSEDPLVTGKIAAAMISGLQSNGIGTSIKHYIANNHEANRAGINVVMDERTAREIYLKGFEIAVKASRPWTVMSSYNLVNGVHTSERKDLLTTILRDEWGFKGYVMTDWGGKAVNLIDQMVAGNDVIMPGNSKQINSIIEAVQQGKLSEKILDRNVERVLRIIELSPSFQQYAYTNKPDLKQHARVSREAGTEGMVLLTNKQALPLAATQRKVALLGNISYTLIAGGTGSGDVNKAYTISLYKGLLNAGYLPDSMLALPYRNHVKDYRNWLKEIYVPDAQLAQAAKDNDHAIVTIGRNSWETKDRSLDSNYQLRPSELSLISRAAKAFHQEGKKLIVVLNVCGVVDTKGWREEADAILLAWQPGQEAGYAITDILIGAINPSGKLATTFPENYTDLSTARNFPGTPVNNPDSVRYEEGIYVGYRYFDAFGVKPAFEFGYGLSYTSFAVSRLALNSAVVKDKLVATAKVTNTGKVAGKEVLQLYITAPAPTIAKPVQELKGFVKTRLLQPGESQVVRFEVPVADLASFYNEKNAWIADAGKYTVQLGTSSQQIRQTAMFSLPKTVITERVHAVLHPSSPLQLLTAEK